MDNGIWNLKYRNWKLNLLDFLTNPVKCVTKTLMDKHTHTHSHTSGKQQLCSFGQTSKLSVSVNVRGGTMLITSTPAEWSSFPLVCVVHVCFLLCFHRLSFYSTTPVPKHQPLCPFSFGANDGEFSSECPSSTHQPAPSTAHTDTAASTGADPAPDYHTPLTTTPPTTLPS